MSDLVNDSIKEEIMEDILEMADKDIWNVIFAIEKEFGVQNMPSPKGNGRVLPLGIHRRRCTSGSKGNAQPEINSSNEADQWTHCVQPWGGEYP